MPEGNIFLILKLTGIIKCQSQIENQDYHRISKLEELQQSPTLTSPSQPTQLIDLPRVTDAAQEDGADF